MANYQQGNPFEPGKAQGQPLQQGYPVQQQQYQPYPPPKKKKKTGLIIAIAVIVFVFVLVGGILALVFGILGNEANRDFYRMGGYDIPTMSYVLGPRTPNNVSTSTSSGETYREVGYAGGQINYDEAAYYMDYLIDYYGFQYWGEENLGGGFIRMGVYMEYGSYDLYVTVDSDDWECYVTYEAYRY